MYKITRKNRIKEELQLCHANGDIAVSLDVDINVDEMAARFNKAYSNFVEANGYLQKNTTSPEAMEQFGNTVIALFTVIFGEDGARKILEFYENHYSEMLVDLFPFINDEIMPKIAEASEERKKQLLAASKKAKKSLR